MGGLERLAGGPTVCHDCRVVGTKRERGLDTIALSVPSPGAHNKDYRVASVSRVNHRKDVELMGFYKYNRQ